MTVPSAYTSDERCDGATSRSLSLASAIRDLDVTPAISRELEPIAILADIHANFPALQAVLAGAAGTSSGAVHLGDVVGYNAFPAQTIARLRAARIAGVHGNHDLMAIGHLADDDGGPRARRAIAWTRAVLTEPDRRFLEELPAARWLAHGVLLTHSCLGDPVARLRTPGQFREEAARLRRLLPSVRVCFTAHTHRPVIVEVTRDGDVRSHGPGELVLNGESLWFVNPGSVGEPRDEDQRAAYAVFDPRTRHVRFLRVAYDRAQVRAAGAALHGRDDPWGRVLVAGADQHQGLAVIRGLGQAGIPVIACGASWLSLGCFSRHASERWTYAPPLGQPERFTDDLLRIVARTKPEVVIPTVESALVLLNGVRSELERHTVLAAPAPDVLEFALDKSKTLALAAELGVPAPRTVQAESVPEILCRAAALRFPVAVKPRGPGLHRGTLNRLGFKVRYAASPDELARLLQGTGSDAKAVLVQELAPGVGRCVAAVCRHGEPLALFAYSRDRELPHTGGISVMRRSIALDARLADYTTKLLRAVGWHGVAMVEFKYDPATGRYTLMEINGRFQASVALSLDAGINLPHLVSCLYTGRRLPDVGPYAVGVTERWLRGDTQALLDDFQWRHWVDFLRAFGRGVYYDEFRLDDWKPGAIEALAIAALPFARLGRRIGRAAGRVASTGRPSSAAVSAAEQRAMRV